MVSFQQGLLGQIRNGFCTVVNTLQDFGFGLDVGAEYRGTKATVDVLRFAQRLVCNREPFEAYYPVFEGGQCFDVCYIVYYSLTVERYDGTPQPPLTQVGLFKGPIVSPTVRTGVSSGFPVWIWEQPNVACNGAPGPITIFTIRQDVYINPGTIGLFIERQDGLPDDCGNPYPVPPPSQPGDRTVPINYTYTDNSSNDINVNGSVTFGDIIIGSNNDVKIPFQVTYDDILPFEFNGTLSLTTGDINLNIGNPNYSPIDKPNPDGYTTDEPPQPLPDVPTDEQPPNANEPDPETKRVIRGVFVTTSVDDSRGTVIDQSSAPDIIAPNLGYINFLIAVSDRTAWTSDIAVKNHRWFCECPFEGGAIDVRGTPRAGVEWTITPVYLQQERAQTFE